MPNIFDGLNRMDENAFRFQLATLETVTVTNLAIEIGQKAKKGSTKLINSVGKLFKSSQIKETEVAGIDERIQKRFAELDVMSNYELNKIMRHVLVTKITSSGESATIEDSNDILSIKIIDLASKNFKEFPSGLTPAQKADTIFNRYNERLMNQIQEKLKKQSPEERLKTVQAIDDKLEDMPQEQRAELEKALGLKNISGATIQKVLTTTTGATAALVMAQASGFGGYVALTTIMHAIFTTALNITLPFAAYTSAVTFMSFITGPFGWFALGGMNVFIINRNKKKLIYELLAQTVWMSVNSYGEMFTPREDVLPSWLTGKEREAAIHQSDDLFSLFNENKRLERIIQTLQSKVVESEKAKLKFKNDIALQQKRESEARANAERTSKEKEQIEFLLCQANKRVDEMKIEFAHITDLNEEQQELFNKAITESESYMEKTRCLEGKLNEAEEMYLDAMQQAENNHKKLEEKEKEKAEMQERIKVISAELDDSKEKEKREFAKSVKALEERWTSCYKKFEFKQGLIKKVIKEFKYEDFGRIERILMEIHQAEDPNAIRNNRGKMNDGTLHVQFSTCSGFPSRLFFTPLKNYPDGKTVRIDEIVKHNDPRYGKNYQ